eukprot:Opistho-1_new@69904
MSAPEKPASKRPGDSDFKQQRLKAWQPILTPQTVIPTFFIVGLIFIPLGAIFYTAAHKVVEVTVDYTDCYPASSPYTCHDHIVYLNQSCKCSVSFVVPERMATPVYMYYGLTNYYQNHGRYVKSRDDLQLQGQSSKAAPDCDPLDTMFGRSYAPCGLIANSLFNDSMTLSCSGVVNGIGCAGNIPLDGYGISWKSDRETKFQNPPPKYNLSVAFAYTLNPPNWDPKVPISEFGQPWTIHPNGYGYQNEDLIVWMRTAALPDFRKLYRKVDQDLVPGYTYTVSIDYRYPVKQFDGTKKVIFSTASWLGGKNTFLGIAYLVVGCICVLLGTVFLIKHIVSPRALGDHQYLKWATS